MHMVILGLLVAGPCRSCWPQLKVFFTIKNWEQLGSSNNAEIQLIIEAASRITSKELELSWNGKH